MVISLQRKEEVEEEEEEETKIERGSLPVGGYSGTASFKCFSCSQCCDGNLEFRFSESRNVWLLAKANHSFMGAYMEKGTKRHPI